MTEEKVHLNSAAIPSNPASLAQPPAPASGEAKDLGGEREDGVKDIINYVIGELEPLARQIVSPQDNVFEKMIRNLRNARDYPRKSAPQNPTTDEAIASAAEEILGLHEGLYKTPNGSVEFDRKIHLYSEIILRALSRVSPSALKKAEMGVTESELVGHIYFHQLASRLLKRIFAAADMSLPDCADAELQLVRLIGSRTAARERIKELELCLYGIVGLGRKDTTNPKYDGYYEHATRLIGK